jgi:hypothetical protein
MATYFVIVSLIGSPHYSVVLCMKVRTALEKIRIIIKVKVKIERRGSVTYRVLFKFFG